MNGVAFVFRLGGMTILNAVKISLGKHGASFLRTFKMALWQRGTDHGPRKRTNEVDPALPTTYKIGHFPQEKADQLYPFTFEHYQGEVQIARVWRYNVYDVILKLSVADLERRVHVRGHDGPPATMYIAMTSNLSGFLFVKLTVRERRLHVRRQRNEHGRTEAARQLVKSVLERAHNVAKIHVLERHGNVYEAELALGEHSLLDVVHDAARERKINLFR